MKAAIYARISTNGKKQDYQNQLIQLRQFASSQGWEVMVEYVDEASGGTGQRSEFQKMLTAASQRQFDILLFWALDRLSREGVRPTLAYLQRLDDYGVCWRSFTEQYLDTTGSFRDAVISILAAVAKQEKIRISERTRAGLAKARAEGKVLGRPRVLVSRRRVLALRKRGLSWEKVAVRLGIGRGTAQRAAKAC